MSYLSDFSFCVLPKAQLVCMLNTSVLGLSESYHTKVVALHFPTLGVAPFRYVSMNGSSTAMGCVNDLITLLWAEQNYVKARVKVGTCGGTHVRELKNVHIAIRLFDPRQPSE